MTRVTQGRVTFVGAGPGLRRWVTDAGLQAVARADVVLVDALVSPALLSDIRWEAEVIDVGKRGGKTSMSQSEICSLLVELAKAQHVVRLKGGDPGTFGRLSEEAQVLRQANIPFDVIPGISAVHAVAARAGFSLTDRDLSASLTMLTGHRRTEGPKPDMDWQAASRSGTGAVYMGSLNAAENTRKLMAEGVPETTPVLVAQAVATSRERMLKSTLGQLADAVENANLRPPVLWIYGDVVGRIDPEALGGSLTKGNVAVFRPFGRHLAWRQAFQRAGYEYCSYPLQTIEAIPIDLAPIFESAPDWLLFTSPTAVDCFWSAFQPSQDVRRLAGVKIAAVGPSTQQALQTRGVFVDLCGQGSGGAKALVERLPDKSGSICFVGARDRDPQAAEQLTARGWRVALCDSHDKPFASTVPAALKIAVARRQLTAAVWTASSQIQYLVEQDYTDLWSLPHIAIGEPTAQTLRQTGAKDITIAKTSSEQGVIDALDLRFAED